MSKRASLDKREKETPKVIKGVMSAFVSSSGNNNETEDDTNSKTESVQKKSQKSKQKSNTNDIESVKESDIIDDTDNDSIDNTNIDTNNNTESVVNNITDNETKEVANDVTKIVTNRTPKITHVKSIKIGNKTLESTYSSDELATRCAYHLRQDTIDKIEVCSKLSGMKKAEFVDLVLNSVLTEILNKGNKK
ncbi:MAG TPA: hypothetical protein DCM59_13005 [Clostridium sp.]|nr:hypothetical protein [Clostridium sp.]